MSVLTSANIRTVAMTPAFRLDAATILGKKSAQKPLCIALRSPGDSKASTKKPSPCFPTVTQSRSIKGANRRTNGLSHPDLSLRRAKRRICGMWGRRSAGSRASMSPVRSFIPDGSVRREVIRPSATSIMRSTKRALAVRSWDVPFCR
eukprot:1168759-Amorphochlora_amoeboformis.AAC.1